MVEVAAAPRLDLTPPPLVRVRPDPSQEAALALVAEGGPVTVFGAPGTGKTLVVELAAVEALRSGRTVLALTPERHVARGLSARIVRRADLALDQRVAVTPQALAMSVLRARADAIAAQPWDGAAEAARAYQPQMVTGADQLAAFAELLRAGDGETGIRWGAVAPGAARLIPAFRAELRDLLMRAAERGLGPEDVSDLGRRFARPGWEEAGRFYAAYLDHLDTRSAADSGLKLDAAAMVAVACARLEDWCEPFDVAGHRVVLSPDSRPRWDLVLADDYQEASLAVHWLMGVLGGCWPTPFPGRDGGDTDAQVVALGSPESAVQGYRGSLPGQLAQTLADPPPAGGGVLAGGWSARSAVLGVSWRQRGQLAECAQMVRSKVRSPGAPRAARLAPAAPAGASEDSGVVRAWTVGSHAEAAAMIARRLRRARILEGTPWERMAVLARTTGQVGLLRSALTSAGVPVHVPGSEVLVADQRAVAPLIQAMRCAVDPAELTPETAVSLMTSVVGGLDAAEVRAVRRALVEAPSPPWRDGDEAPQANGGVSADGLLVGLLGGAPGGSERSAELLTALRAAGLEAAVADRVARLARALEAGRGEARAAQPSAARVLWAVWDGTGLAASWQDAALSGGPAGVRADADLDAVLALFAAARRHDSRQVGSGVVGFLSALEAQEAPSDTIAPQAPESGKVNVSTVTAAVGREWDLVALTGLEEDVWPDPRLRDTLLGAGQMADLVDGKGWDVDPVERRRAVLEDEARLLTLAVTRARRELVALAVESEDERPSRFFAWLARAARSGEEPDVDSSLSGPTAAGPDGRPLPFDLRGLVAAARARLVAAAGRDARERELAAGPPASAQPEPSGATGGEDAAAVLAILAAAGVDGASPESWPGLAPPSSQAPLWSENERPALSPSALERLSECPLSWVLGRVGGRVAAGAQADLGSLIHSLAEEFGSKAVLDTTAGAEELRERIEARLAERWPELGLEDNYTSRGLRLRAENMARHLAGWLDARRGLTEVLVERRIDPVANPAEDGLPVRIVGVVDRIETDSAGRTQVVDFKTSANAVTAKAAEENPQLGAYQLALAEGLVEDCPPTVPSGARLVYLDQVVGGRVKELAQPPLSGTGQWMTELLEDCRVSVSRPWFEARAGGQCRNCDVRSSCPAWPQGQQVTA